MGWVISPADPSKMYAGGHPGFYRSEDGGRTWSQDNSGLPGTDVHGLGMDPQDPQTLYAYVVNEGLYRSPDAGRSWELVNAGFGAMGPILVDPRRKDTLYVAAMDASFQRSTDGGETWQRQQHSWLHPLAPMRDEPSPSRMIQPLLYLGLRVAWGGRVPRNYLARLLILRNSSCCLRHPYWVTPRGLYIFSINITSNTTRPSPGWRRSPPSPSRLAPSASWATSAMTLTSGMCKSKTTVAKMVSTSENRTQ